MATGTATLTITRIDRTVSTTTVYGTVKFSAATDTYATHGLILNGLLTDQIKAFSAPIEVDIAPALAAGTSPSGWQYYFCPGTTLANGTVVIMNGTTEFTNAAPLTAPFADTLQATFVFLFGV